MKIIITGGAGFIGSNTAHFYLKKGDEVVLFDNLSRPNTEKNLSWLKSTPGKLTFIKGDIRSLKDTGKLISFMKDADCVLHLAAQVAVTTSVKNPREDFEINALGTLNVLEAMRTSGSGSKLIYASTNKVYGGMEDVRVVEKASRYMYRDMPFGADEQRVLDFHSPYGCSKGSADQYVRDYSRIYGLDTVVMRQSCIYGPRQFGMEDQGWVAWFIIAIMQNKHLTVYGDGKQVRDLLYVDDLVRAYDMALRAGKKTSGKVYNIGGGSKNTLSVWAEFGPMLESLFGKKLKPTFGGWRPGDQKIFVADVRRAKKEFGWAPQISVHSGVKELFGWITANKRLFS